MRRWLNVEWIDAAFHCGLLHTKYEQVGKIECYICIRSDSLLLYNIFNMQKKQPEVVTAAVDIVYGSSENDNNRAMKFQ